MQRIPENASSVFTSRPIWDEEVFLCPTTPVSSNEDSYAQA